MKQIFLQTYGSTCLKLMNDLELGACLATEEFLNALWYPKVHHHVYKSLCTSPNPEPEEFSP
jgi:hypothetical protein